METYSEFMDRINSFAVPELGINEHNFTPSESVKQKVERNGTFKRFYGDTTIFDLTEEERRKLYYFVDFLYSHVPECFGERLAVRTMHMTLHDLSSSNRYEKINHKMHQNQAIIEAAILGEKRLEIEIRMRSNYIINMVNTSLVMCFCPVDEEGYNELMRLYSIMDEAVMLPYRFTPHVTLAYYNPNGFCYDSAHRLTEYVNALNRHKSVDLVLNTKRLGYYTFDNMNAYFHWFNLF